jgi:hypothetical protein
MLAIASKRHGPSAADALRPIAIQRIMRCLIEYPFIGVTHDKSEQTQGGI